MELWHMQMLCWAVAFMAGVSAVIVALLENAPKQTSTPAASPGTLRTVSVMPAREMPPILSSDEMTMSGELDLLDDPDGDLRQRETQPIPVEGKDKDAGAIGEGHGLFSFYRKLADPKLYTLPERGYPPHKIVDVRPHRLFDTQDIQPTTGRQYYFVTPRGHAGRTEQETNLEIGGCLPNPMIMVFHTVLIQFLDRGAVELMKKGHFLLIVGSRTELDMPLSMFTPLTLEADPQIFFSTMGTVLLPPQTAFRAVISIEDGLEQKTKMRVVLPGLMGREVQ